jgi:type III restriction enzyme
MAHVIEQNTLRLEAVFDGERPVGSTRDMRTWYTTRVAEPTQRSQVSHIVVDSGWEKYAANVAETHPDVAAWAKNDHLGFHILYLWNGTKRKYILTFWCDSNQARPWCWKSRARIHRRTKPSGAPWTSGCRP